MYVLWPPQARNLRRQADSAWAWAIELSDATGTKYKGRDGKRCNDRGDLSMTGIAMARWCEKKGFEWS